MKKRLLPLFFLLFTCTLVAQDYSQIYLIGNAAPNGWDNQKAEAFTQILLTDDDAIYEWTGRLKSGDFKFINILGTWDPCFNAKQSDEPVILNTTHELAFNTNGENDHKFIITKGLYTVTINLKKLTMVITEANTNLPIELWMTGSAIPDSSVKLIYEPDGYKGQFRYNGKLTSGDIKLITTETITAETKYIVPSISGINILDNTDLKITNINADGWHVDEDGTYKIKFDLYSNKSAGSLFVPCSALYIVGGCTNATWAAEQAIELNKDENNPNIFVFDGELRINEGEPDNNLFKFLAQQDWGPIQFLSNIANKPILEADYIFENYPDDNKWAISEDKQGRYIITIDLLNETISAVFGNLTDIKPQTEEKFIFSTSNKQIKILKAGSDVNTVEIFDITGNKITYKKNVIESSILADNLSLGTYIIHVNIGGNSQVYKVFVE